jgi:integrase
MFLTVNDHRFFSFSRITLAALSTGVAVAQRQLRHADAAATLGYGHVLRNDHRDAMDAIESVFFEPSGSRSGSEGK